MCCGSLFCKVTEILVLTDEGLKELKRKLYDCCCTVFIQTETKHVLVIVEFCAAAD